MIEKTIPTGAEARLLGELIGLARGTDGSEHLITPPVTQVVAAALCAHGGDALLDALRETVVDAKRQVVPGCFTCASPCGRTAPFDFEDLRREPQKICREKLELLALARDLAEEPRVESRDRLLYQALIAIGIEEIDPEALHGLMDTIRNA